VAFEDFTQLNVYQAAEQIGDAVWSAVREWDRFASSTIGEQATRAADSIGANLAEGWGRDTWKERTRYAHIARGSLTELRHWLRCAHRRGLLTKEQVAALKPLIEKIEPMLNAYITHLKRRTANARGVKEPGVEYEPADGHNAVDPVLENESTSQQVNESPF